MFETLIVRPIFNLLLILYAVIGDFGIAIILFTVLIRFAMWPLLRKQLHQSKVMREIQPKIKQLRKQNKGNRQAESLALMELYKEHGVNPVGSLGLLFVQLPVFFGLFSALRSFISDPQRLITLPYAFIRDNSAVQEIITNVAVKTTEAIQSIQDSTIVEQATRVLGGLPATADSLHAVPKEELHTLFTQTLTSVDMNGVHSALVQGPFFDQHLFGFIKLSGRAIEGGVIYWPVMIIAILAGVFQFMQTRQLMPKDPNSKSVKEIMKEAAKSGKEPDQAEVSAAVGKRMGAFFSPLIVLISATAPAGLALYFSTSGLVGMLQQRKVLHQDVDEMEEIADKLEEADTEQAWKKRKKKKRKR
jgi:YidC/Oxa1 family membrane protein insertase